MASIPQNVIDDIRSKANIVDVIRHYIPVMEKGNGYVAVCPFHDDHDPSLKISTDKQIYRCFVCGNGGTLFQFVQDFEKVSFPEAVEKVGEIVGIHVQSAPKKEVVEDPQTQKIKNVLSDATSYFSYILKTNDGLKAKEYLKLRGIDEETALKFGIGYNPYRKLYSYLKAKGYSEEEMSQANLIRYYNGRFDDVFQDRITFAIHDRNGQTVGYTARSMDSNVDSKYINTDNTLVFHKGSVIYNYHRAKNPARRAGKIYLCEGVMDVIALGQAGIENAVCTLGTACTVEQMRLLASMAPILVLVYDGDNAGQNASYKVAKLAQSIGLECRIVKNMDNLDPDEIYRQKGKEVLEKFIKQEESFMEFFIDYRLKNTNLDNYSEKKKVGQEIALEIQNLNDEMDRHYFQHVLEEKLGLNFSILGRKEAKKTHTTRVKVDGVEVAEYEILAMMLQYPKAIQIFDEELGFLTDTLRNNVALTLVNRLHRKQEIQSIELLEAAQSEMERKCWSKLISMNVKEYQEESLRALFDRVKMKRLEEQSRELYDSLSNPSLDETTKKLLLQKYSEVKRELGRLKSNEEKKN
ncbi:MULTISPECIES: DNA primase [Terrabacteria group]|uniref:DNA primase n=1 Tax=Bacillati TaxID=1783272 RepID=UPI001C6E2641|nr:MULTISPECIES: DNA primase [Terrabacteria group]MBW9212388.1 DNA primase [Trueperella sp. zg.1013]